MKQNGNEEVIDESNKVFPPRSWLSHLTGGAGILLIKRKLRGTHKRHFTLEHFSRIREQG